MNIEDYGYSITLRTSIDEIFLTHTHTHTTNRYLDIKNKHHADFVHRKYIYSHFHN